MSRCHEMRSVVNRDCSPTLWFAFAKKFSELREGVAGRTLRKSHEAFSTLRFDPTYDIHGHSTFGPLLCGLTCMTLDTKEHCAGKGLQKYQKDHLVFDSVEGTKRILRVICHFLRDDC